MAIEALTAVSAVDFIRWAIIGIGSLAVFFLHKTLADTEKQIHNINSRLTEMEKDITTVKLAYLSKEDFKEFKTEIRQLFVDLKQDILDMRNEQR